MAVPSRIAFADQGLRRGARCAAPLAALVLLAGCPRVPPRDLSRDPADLAAQVRAAQQRVRAVRGSARVAITSREVSGTVNELVAAEAGARVDLEWRDDLEVNPALDRSLFELSPPRGVRVVDLAAGQPIPRFE